MSQYKPYPAYKDSGVEWLGRVPEHWDVRRLKFLAICVNSNVDKKSHEGELPTRLCNYTDLYYNERITDALEFMQATATADEISRFSLRADDVLLTKDSETPDDIGIPALVERSAEGVVCGYHLTVIRPEPPADGGYLFRALQAHPSAAQFYLGASGVTRYGLSKGSIDNLLTCVPPQPEQRQIAIFLDRETARIDALIEKKQRLIELLKEKRQALITQAVTKGLDPNVPMKDSGVEWLGEVPAHWAPRRLKHIVPDITVGIVVTPAKYYVDNGVPCLRSLNISSGQIDGDDLVYISAESNELHSKSKIFEGDIVVVRTGQTGATAVVTGDYHGANCIDLLIIRRSAQLLTQYLYYVISSDLAMRQVEARSVGAIQAHYNTSTLGEMWLPLPSLAEQHDIAEFIFAKIDRIDRIVSKTNSSIGLLQEHRAALITAAVTGQIDVRDAA